MRNWTRKWSKSIALALIGLSTIHAHAQNRADILWMVNGGGVEVDSSDDVPYHPDGKHFFAVSSDNKLLAASAEQGTYVWNIETRRLVATFPYAGLVAFAPDNRTLGIASPTRDTVTVVDIISRTVVRTITVEVIAITAIGFSNDILATASIASVSGRLSSLIQLWRISDGAEVRRISLESESGTYSLAFSPDGSLLATGHSSLFASGDYTVRLWRRDGSLAQRLEGHTGLVASLSFSPDGRRLVSASRYETRLWQVGGGFIRGFPTGASHVFFVGNERIVTSGKYFYATVWNVLTGIDEQRYSNRGSTAFLDDDVAVSFNDTPYFWQRSNGQVINGFLPGHAAPINAVALSSNGDLVATVSSDRSVRLWRASDGQQMGQLTGHTNSVNAVAFSPNGPLIATGSSDYSVRLWNALNGQQVRQLIGHTGSVNGVAFSPNGELVASVSSDRTVRLWRVADGSQARPPINLGDVANSVAFSPDGSLLATAVGNTVRIWRLSDGQEVARAAGHTNTVMRVVFSPDGQLLATCGRDGTARLWQVSSGIQVRQIDAPASSVRFSPDGQMLVTVGYDETIRFWRVSDGAELERYYSEAVDPNDVAYSPDGERIAVVGADGTLLLARAYREGMNRRPSAPTLIAPENDVTVSLTPTFRVGVQDPDGNRVKAIIEITDSAGGTRTVESGFADSGAEVSVQVTTPLAEGRYSWRARAQDEGGLLSDWSGYRTFRAAQTGVPEPPELLEPANGASVGTRPVFRVRLNDPNAEPVKARIEISNAGGVVATFESGFVESGQTATAQPPQPLAQGAYTWRARAIDNSGNESEWSGSLSFTVAEQGVTIGVPELISPAFGAYTVRTPTFRVRASQPSGAQVLYEIRLIRGDEEYTFTTDEVTVGVPAVLRLSESDALSPGRWQWQARTVAADGSGESEWSELRTLNVMGEEAPLALEPGVHAFAFSFAGSDAGVADIGLQGAELYYWDPTQGTYVRAQQLQSGIGYFVRVTERATLELAGTPATTEVRVNLRSGWNLIANPFIAPIAWDLNTIQVERGGERKSLRDAQQAGWLEDYMWTWDSASGRYQIVYDSAILPGVLNQMLPWRSYWILALQDCTLILTPPSAASSRVVLSSVNRSTAWTLRVEAETSRGVSNPVWIGASSGRSVQMATAPTPPTVEARGLQLRIRRSAAQYSADLRAEYGRSTRWELEVVAPPDTQPQTVTLRFGNLMQLPRGVNLALIEEGTGRRYLLRSRSAHSFAVPAEGGVYRFTIEPVSSRQVLRILTPTVQSAGRSGATTLRYSLTAEAHVQVQIRAGGRTVRTLTNQVTRSAGSHEAIWDGRDDAGVQLPPGQYIAEITAVSEDGQVARATVPVVKTR